MDKQTTSYSTFLPEHPPGSIAQLAAWLYQLPSSAEAIHSQAEGLQRMQRLLALLGNPQERIPTIHIAGTSGKGTIAYMVSRILAAHGLRVGTHLSPHVVDLNERWLVNCAAPPAKLVLAASSRLLAAIHSLIRDGRDMPPTYFEATTALAWLVFALAELDYAVIETGMGGTYDATNTIRRSDKLAIIGRLGYDHTAILGRRLSDIAQQKAGIIPTGGYAIALKPPSNQIQAVLSRAAQHRQAELQFVPPLPPTAVSLSRQGTCVQLPKVAKQIAAPPIRLPLLGSAHGDNLQLAWRACLYLAKRDHFDWQPETARVALGQQAIPGRGQCVTYQGYTTVIDGAHNPQKMSMLVQTLQTLGNNAQPVWVIGIKRTKPARAILEIISRYAVAVVFVSFFSRQAAAHGSGFAYSAEELRAIWQQLDTAVPSYTATSVQSGLACAAKQADQQQLIIVSGSLYMLSELPSQLLLTTRQ